MGYLSTLQLPLKWERNILRAKILNADITANIKNCWHTNKPFLDTWKQVSSPLFATPNGSAKCWYFIRFINWFQMNIELWISWEEVRSYCTRGTSVYKVSGTCGANQIDNNLQQLRCNNEDDDGGNDDFICWDTACWKHLILNVIWLEFMYFRK